MPKKFFDIIPPQKIEVKIIKEAGPKKENLIKKQVIKSLSETKKEKAEKLVPEVRRDNKKTERKPVPIKFLFKGIICRVVFFIIVFVACYSIFSKVEIEIWPKTEDLNLKETITVDSRASQPDFSAKTIPGKVLTDQRTASQEFSATGKVLKEEKAKGIIRVYNAYSSSSQPLLASTRFVSTDGKLFKSIKREVIPGATYEKGKLVPSYLDIEVQAAGGGEEYNIGPSTFSIPGFVGTSKYTAFYGKSLSPMKGGFKGEVPQVTSMDLIKAKESVANKLKKESQDSLKAQVQADFILLEETISQEIVREEPSVKAGSEAGSFSFQVEIKSEVIAFKKADIDSFAKNLINSNIPKDKKFQESKLQINFSI